MRPCVQKCAIYAIKSKNDISDSLYGNLPKINKVINVKNSYSRNLEEILLSVYRLADSILVFFSGMLILTTLVTLETDGTFLNCFQSRKYSIKLEKWVIICSRIIRGNSGLQCCWKWSREALWYFWNPQRRKIVTRATIFFYSAGVEIDSFVGWTGFSTSIALSAIIRWRIR